MNMPGYRPRLSENYFFVLSNFSNSHLPIRPPSSKNPLILPSFYEWIYLKHSSSDCLPNRLLVVLLFQHLQKFQFIFQYSIQTICLKEDYFIELFLVFTTFFKYSLFEIFQYFKKLENIFIKCYSI